MATFEYDDSAPSTPVDKGSLLKDVGISAAKGVVGLGQAAVGLGNLATGGAVGTALQNAGVDLDGYQKSLGESQSEEAQRQFQEVDSAKGFVDTAGALLSNPRALGLSAVEMLPSMLGGGVVGAGVKKAVLSAGGKMGGLAAGATGEGVISAGQAAETTRRENPNDTAAMYWAVPQGALVAAASMATGGLSRTRLGSKALGDTDIDEIIANAMSGKAGKEVSDKAVKEVSDKAVKATPGVLGRIGQGFAREGVVEEGSQSLIETGFQNKALGKEDLTEGLGKNVAQGAILGGVMGSAAGIVSGRSRSQADSQNVEIGRRIYESGNPLPENANPSIAQGFEQGRVAAYEASPEGIAEKQAKIAEGEAMLVKEEADKEARVGERTDRILERLGGDFNQKAISGSIKRVSLEDSAIEGNDPDTTNSEQQIIAQRIGDALAIRNSIVGSIKEAEKAGADPSFESIDNDAVRVMAKTAYPNAKSLLSEESIRSKLENGVSGNDILDEFKKANVINIPVGGSKGSVPVFMLDQQKAGKDIAKTVNAYKNERKKLEGERKAQEKTAPALKQATPEISAKSPDPVAEVVPAATSETTSILQDALDFANSPDGKTDAAQLKIAEKAKAKPSKMNAKPIAPIATDKSPKKKKTAEKKVVAVEKKDSVSPVAQPSVSSVAEEIVGKLEGWEGEAAIFERVRKAQKDRKLPNSEFASLLSETNRILKDRKTKKTSPIVSKGKSMFGDNSEPEVSPPPRLSARKNTSPAQTSTQKMAEFKSRPEIAALSKDKRHAAYVEEGRRINAEQAREKLSKAEREELDDDLLDASKRGTPELIDPLIAKGADVNARDDFERTPLMFASSRGDKETALYLIENGADVNASNANRWSPLIGASINGHAEMIHFLIANGADVNAKSIDGQSPMFFASNNGHAEASIALIDNGADVNERGSLGWTPLMKAADGGYTETVLALISNGAVVDAKDSFGSNALKHAERKGNTETVAAIENTIAAKKAAEEADALDSSVKKASSSNELSFDDFLEPAAPAKPRSVSLRAKDSESAKAREKLSEAEREDLDQELIIAAKRGHSDVVSTLLASGADVNANTDGKSTSLIWAARRGYSDVVKVLIANGADVGARDYYKNTALIYAASNGHSDIVSILISNGSDVNASEEKGDTSLMLAARSGNSDIVSILLSAGADVNATNNFYKTTAIDLAARNGHSDTVKVIEDHIAKLATEKEASSLDDFLAQAPVQEARKASSMRSIPVSKGVSRAQNVSSDRAGHIVGWLKSLPVLEKFADKVVIAKNHVEYLSNTHTLSALDELYGKDKSVYGMFDEETGQVVIFSDAFNGTEADNRKNAIETFLHEAMHGGIRKSLNAKTEAELNKMLTDLHSSNEEVRRLVAIAQKDGRFDPSAPMHLKVEEAMAMASETENFSIVRNPKLLERAVNAIKAFFKKAWNVIGASNGSAMIENTSPRDLIRMLKRSREEGLNRIKGPGVYVDTGNGMARLPLLKSAAISKGTLEYLDNLKTPVIPAYQNIGRFVNGLLFGEDAAGENKGFKLFEAFRTNAQKAMNNKFFKPVMAAFQKEDETKNRYANVLLEPFAKFLHSIGSLDGSLGSMFASLSSDAKKVVGGVDNTTLKVLEKYAFEDRLMTRQELESRISSDGHKGELAKSVSDAYFALHNLHVRSVDLTAMANEAHLMNYVILQAQNEMVETPGIKNNHVLLNAMTDRIDNFRKKVQKAESAAEMRALRKEVGSIVKNQTFTNEFNGIYDRHVKAHNEIVADLSKRFVLPVNNFGKYVVSVLKKDGVFLYDRSFDSKEDAMSFADQAENGLEEGLYVRITTGSELSNAMFGGIGRGNLDEGVKLLLTNKKDVIGAMKMTGSHIIAATKEMQGRLEDKNRKHGGEKDIAKIVNSMVSQTSKYVAENMTVAETLEAINSIPSGQGRLRDDAIKTYKYVHEEKEAGGRIRGALFQMFIGGNISSAMLQLTQGPMMTYPFLNQYSDGYGLSDVMRNLVTVLGGNMTKDQKEFIANLSKIGGISSTETIDALLTVASGSGRMSSAARLWGGMFASMEMANRVSAALSAREAWDKMDSDARFEFDNNPLIFAKETINKTQGVYSKYNRPDISRGTAGAIIMTFKMYTIQYLELLANLPPKQRAKMLAMLFIVAGGAGAPFAEDLLDAIQLVSEAAGNPVNPKKAVVEALNELLGETAGSFVFGGLTSLPGMPVSAQARSSMGNIVPGSKLFTPSNTDKFKETADIFGVGGGYAYSLIKAVNEIMSARDARDVVEAVKGASPTAVKNIMTGADIAITGEHRSAAGKVVAKYEGAESIVKGLIKAVGYQAGDIQSMRNRQEFIRVDEAQLEMVRKGFVKELTKAYASKDLEERKNINLAAVEWNRGHLKDRMTVDIGKMNQTAAKNAFMNSLPEMERQRMLAPGRLKPRYEAELKAVRDREKD